MSARRAPTGWSLLGRMLRARLRRTVRAIHRSRSGVVLEQICLLIVLVIPIWAATPKMLYLVERYFYRIAATVSGPFP
jgi:hypothetical protein